MYRTKLTQKGQITVPLEYREKLNLATGSVVEIKMKNKEILLKKAEEDLDKLFGKWKNLSEKSLKELRSAWKGWNAKDFNKL